MWGCVGRDLDVVPYWRSLYLCVGFFSVAAELCILSSCWGWGRLLLCLFWCDCSAIFLGHLRFSTLCQRCSPSAASPSGFCALARCVSMSDSSLLVYSWGCAGGVCAVPLTFSPMCRALPQGLQRALLSLMQVHWGFSGHRVSVLLLPWWHGLGFSPSLLFLCFSCSACLQGWPGLYTLCQGAPVTVMSPWFGARSPCYPSLTLGWVCFWPAVSQAFVVRHDFGFVDA